MAIAELPILYALVVGIDKYKSSNVPSLRGCENDATRIADFLTKQYENAPEKLHLHKPLLSAEATRQAIIDAFRNHLCQAPDGATVYFHYSGHGSTEEIPMAMMEYTADSKNQTMVCHDSRTVAEDGFSPIFDLADKELAILIEEAGKDKPNLHIILSLDCCHSGGGSREGLPDDAPRKRQTTAGQQRTDLKQYLDEYYSKQFASAGKLSIPAQSHVLFSACSPTELAWESNGQGMFTYCYLEVLRSMQNPFELSYGEIFEYIQIAVRQKGGKQTPQVEAFGTGNMWRTYLSNQDAPNLNEVKALFYDEKTSTWLLNAGALDGLKALPNAQDYPLEIQDKDKNAVGKAILTQDVRLERSALEGEGLPALDQKLTYYASVAHLPQFQIKAFCAPNAQEAKENEPIFDTQNQLLRQFQWVENEAEAHYKIEKDAKNNFNIIHLGTQKIIGKTPEAGAVYATLAKIGKWETLQSLQNTSTRLEQEKFELAFETFSLADNRWVKNTTNSVHVSFEGNQVMGFRIHTNNQTAKELHVALLLVSPLFGVYSLGNTALPAGKNTVFFDSTNPDALTDGLQFLDEQSEDKETDWFFQCIVSTERVNEAMYEQDNFSLNLSYAPNRSEEDDDAEGRGMKKTGEKVLLYSPYDWFTEKIQVHIEREEGTKEIKGTTDLGNVVIESTEGFSAEVSVGNLESASRGISNSTNEVWRNAMQSLDLQIIGTNAGGSRSASGGQEIITLTNIKGTVSEDKPLRLTLKEAVKDDEIVVSFANVGGVLMPIGYSSPTDRQKVEIFTLPTATEEVKTGSRGVLGSIGVALYKVITRPFGVSSDSAFWLRKVDHEQEVDKIKVKYTQDDDLIRQEVGKAGSGRILLVVHGILGSTDDIALFAHELVKRGKYDLVLAYDYENLNESIRGIADHLQRRLIGDTQEHKGEKFAGVGVGKDKKIDIIAHSMGGLVSRFMIEQMQGSEFVQRLIMCGTPNGGSNFGLLNKGRKFLSVASMIGLQFFAPITLTGWLLGFTKKVASGSSLLFNTLGEMERDSDFLRQLNVNGRAGGITYFILAGDIHNYKPDGVSTMGNVIDNVLEGVGDLLNAGKANDIAVLTSDIKQTGKNEVPATNIFDIPCHHLNYFTEPNSVQKLIDILG